MEEANEWNFIEEEVGEAEEVTTDLVQSDAEQLTNLVRSGTELEVGESNSIVVGDKLTGKHLIFVHHYLTNGLNATRAAKAAGYAFPSEEGSRLLRNVRISTAIAEILKDKLPNPALVLAEMARGAFAGQGCYVLNETTGKPEIDWKRAEENGCLDMFQVSYSRDGKEIVTVPYKAKCLELLAKYHGLLTDRSERSNNTSIAVVISDTRNSAPDYTISNLDYNVTDLP